MENLYIFHVNPYFLCIFKEVYCETYTLIPPFKFQRSLTYCIGGDVVLKNFEMAAILDIRTEQF